MQSCCICLYLYLSEQSIAASNTCIYVGAVCFVFCPTVLAVWECVGLCVDCVDQHFGQMSLERFPAPCLLPLSLPATLATFRIPPSCSSLYSQHKFSWRLYILINIRDITNEERFSLYYIFAWYEDNILRAVAINVPDFSRVPPPPKGLDLSLLTNTNRPAQDEAKLLVYWNKRKCFITI